MSYFIFLELQNHITGHNQTSNITKDKILLFSLIPPDEDHGPLLNHCLRVIIWTTLMGLMYEY